MKQDKLFIVMISGIILSLSLGIFIRGKKEMSIKENRPLAYFTKLSKDSFMSSDFQNNTEDALVDQVVLGERFKGAYNSIKNKNFNTVVDGLKILRNKENKTADKNNPNKQENVSVETNINEPTNLEFELSILPRGNELFEIEDSNHLIFSKANLDYSMEGFKPKAENYNNLVKKYPDLDYSIYYIELDLDVDFLNGVINHELIEAFYGYLDPSIKKSALYINSLADFQKYFYKKDHHWNALGHLEGYRQIITNLKGEDE